MNDEPCASIRECRNCAVRQSFPSRNPFGLSRIIRNHQRALKWERSTSAIQKRDAAIDHKAD